MATFPTHTPETAPEAARPILAGAKAGWGFVPNLHAKLAEAPVTLEAYGHLFDAFGKTSLTPAEQQVAYLTVSAIHECEYCVSGHSVLAQGAGLDAATIEALREGGRLADAKLEALRAYTAALVNLRGRVPPRVLQDFLDAGYTSRQALEVLVAVAAKTISNYANHLTGTPLDGFMAKTAWVAPSRRARAAA
ncbi:carboxymuconolactone decarboxylase family protein [Falsiroseomonas bella]|uniref:carboxymuconolactone decarboxylase family protein n=1 Tax=Falsiroseomonas bella TaxID=2184016 RepID=UPI001E5D3C9E|nr:carboxymuconolactone decarboxylase family protein [Falsiroseomonas bella]